MTPNRILVVEDESIVALDIGERLARLGYELAGQAAGGEQAVTLAGERRPDLVLMDVRLQGAMDGIAAAREIRSRFRAPVVFVTAYAEDATLDRAKLAEPFGYILKPFDDRELKSAIEIALHKHRAELERERLVAALAQVAEAVVVTDSQGLIRYVNPAFEAVSGYTAAEVTGRKPSLLKSGCHDGAFYRRLWETVAAGRTWQGRLTNRRKDGTLFVEDATISPVGDGSGAVVNYVAVKRDMTEELRRQTEREALEERLSQARQMEAVGRLAAGVAHDFNNLLTGILHQSELCRDSLAADHPAGLHLDEIRDHTEQAAELVRQLLAFARQQPIAPVLLDLNDAVVRALTLLRGLVGEDIALAWMPGASLWSVRMDPGQVDQVLVNLAGNARDAIAGTGRLTLRSENVTVRAGDSADHGDAAPGDYVRLSVTDTGDALTQAAMEHVFEPFYPTRGVGRSAGLGLATVYGIVQQNRGFADVRGDAEGGTTFRVYLPRAAAEPRPDPAPTPAPERPRGTETVLLVEDEKALRVTCCRFLEALGYVVLTAATPAIAIEMAAKHGGEIDLLLTDVVMPGMNGAELARRLQESRPTLRRLFMSGYTADAIAHRGVLDEGVQFLQKPFSRDDLARTVRTVLGRPGSAVGVG
jgi:PAS domain S-box-containing protein